MKSKKQRFTVDQIYYVILLESIPSITPLILKKETDQFLVFQMNNETVRIKKQSKYSMKKFLDNKEDAESFCKDRSRGSINHAIDLLNNNIQSYYNTEYWVDLIDMNLYLINDPSCYYRDFISF